MQILFSQSYGDDQYEQIAARLRAAPAGSLVEAWLFAGPAQRCAIKQRIEDQGFSARIYSAYKPLVCSMAEQPPPAGINSAVLRYPTDHNTLPKRFLIEAYPLAALLGAEDFRSQPQDKSAWTYHLELTDGAGERTTTSIFAPNRERRDHLGETVIVPCSWLRITDGDGQQLFDAALTGPLERLFDDVMAHLAGYEWGDEQPFFERLLIEATFPGDDVDLGVGDEVVSLHEAVHEDFYFSLLELFQRRIGKPDQDRTLRPGQIVPDIRRGSHYAARVVLSSFSGADLPDEPLQDLASAGAPLSPRQIRQALDGLGGERIEGSSRQDRIVAARYLPGDQTGVLLSAGQHANETSGIVGLLRAAPQLAERGRGNLAVIALENPDGYELHRMLRVHHARHMHHAARYTAFGDDVEYREEPNYERTVRLDAVARTKAVLHINLHGYPAHEWTRPFTGYVPRGFAHWTLPKGFVLIFRHKPGLGELTHRFARSLAARLAQNSDLVELNRRQRLLFEAHAGPLPFDVFDDIPCSISEKENQIVPLTLISEYPDETIYGDAFRLAHQVQMETVLAGIETLDEGFCRELGELRALA